MNRRMFRLHIDSLANDPLLRVIDHTHELTEYVLLRVIDCLKFDVAAVLPTGALVLGSCFFIDVHVRFVSPIHPAADSPIRSH